VNPEVGLRLYGVSRRDIYDNDLQWRTNDFCDGHGIPTDQYWHVVVPVGER